MADKSASADLLRAFVADEESGEGRFWTMNWHRIAPLAGKAPALLPPDEVEPFFLHYLRRGGAPSTVAQAAIPPLLAAYRRLLPGRRRGGYADHWHVLTFLFGFVQDGATPGVLNDAATLKDRQKLVAHLLKFSHLPGMRAKAKGLEAFTGQAGHILDVLRLLGYRLDYGAGENDSYDYTNVRYWGFVFVVLLSKDHRTTLLDEMLDASLDLPRRPEMLAILNEFVQAVLPRCNPDETAFRELAAHLAKQEAARSGRTESAALAATLNLPFAEGEDWVVDIKAPAPGHTAWYNPPHVTLTFRPDPDHDWQLQLVAGTHRFSEWSGHVTQNDGGLEPLGKGNLAAFPAWLRRVRDEHGLVFDFSKGRISCGKKRSAAKLLLTWIESEL
ncbi:hypothetical protein [Enterovirga rhinocerotis]|uniref:Uncharacterized protein n=1 Tax=Enterovirga rhinocerotis TaxID=1339210 RepID=A0A4R7C656_9HYPH|nr:hypothetical protein [Enterovirga rhinocerotis]TDR93593.1 hypothetical protein EV668_0858 [Enterovirga rhinocerotis]